MMIAKEEEAITKDDLQAMKDMIGDIKKDPSLLYRLSSLPGGGGGGDPSSAPINNFAAVKGRNTSAGKIFLDDDATDVSSLGMMSSSDYNGGSNHSFGGAAVDPMSPNIKIHAGMNPSSFASAAANAVVRRTNHDAEIALRMQSLRAKRGLLPTVPAHQATSQPRMGGGNVHHSPMRSRPPVCDKPAGAAAVPSAPSNAAPAANGNKNMSGATMTPAAAASAAILHQSKKAPPRADVPSVVASTAGRHSDPGSVRQMASARQHQQRRMQKKLEGRRSSYDEGSIKSGRSSDGILREGAQETALSVKSDDSENSVALVLYDGENANQSPELADRNEKNDNANLSERALALSSGAGCAVVGQNNCAKGQQPLPAAQYYHSAVSKYGTEETSPTHNNAKGGQNGEAATTQQRRSTRDKLNSSSVRRSKIEGKINPENRGTQNSEAQKVSAPVSKRSRSELPRNRSSRGKLRSNSVQPVNREPASHRLQQHDHHSSTRSRSKRRQKILGDPPSLAASAKSLGPVLDRDSLIANLRAEQQQSTVGLLDDTESEAKEKNRVKEPAALSHGKGRGHPCKHRSDSPPVNDREESLVTSKGIEQTHAAMDGGGERKNGSYKRGGGDEVIVFPKDRTIEPDAGIKASENRSRHSNGGFEVDKKCNQLIPQSEQTLGHGLAQLSGTDRSGVPRRRPSVESESGKSVISRLSQLRRVKSKAPSKRSVCSHDNAAQRSSYSDCATMKPPGSDSSDHCHPNGGHPRDHKSKGGIVSRISQNFGGTSPRVTARRRMTEANESFGRKPGQDDDISSGGRRHQVCYSEDHLYIADEDEPDHVAMGIELAMRSGEVPRLCDERGRCLFHPHIRLQKPRLFGGWKILFKHCPDCAVEHMKRTQEKLASIQRQRQVQKEREQRERERDREKQQRGQQKKIRKKSHRKEKEREKIKADPIIGKNVGDKDFTVEQNKVKKRSNHNNRKKEKEKLKEKSREDFAETTASLSHIENSSEDHTMKKNRPPLHHHQSIDHSHNQQQQVDTADEKKHHDDECGAAHQPQSVKGQQQQQQTLLPLQDDESSSLAIVDYKPKTKTKKRVNGLPWSDYNGHSGRYTGEVNEQYLPHGQGEMVYDRGIISAGVWFNGVLDTEGGMEEEDNRCGFSEEEYTPDSLPNYAIGDKGRDDDMVIDSKKVTATAVAELRVNDAAFVRRSDGSWTYAVVKDRTHGGEDNQTIRFKVNLRGSTKAFPTSQWGTYVRRIKPRAPDAPAPKHSTLGDFLDSKKAASTAAPRSSNSVSANLMRGTHMGDTASVSSVHSAPMRMRRSTDNLTTGKMKIRTRSRSRSRSRKNVTTLPLLFSSSMSVSEENDEGQNNDDWETASGSGYRLRGIDP